MNGHISMSLLESVVFPDVVQVITADDDGSLHLHFLDNPGQDTSTNGHIPSEGAFLVNVMTVNGLDTKKLLITYCCKHIKSLYNVFQQKVSP